MDRIIEHKGVIRKKHIPYLIGGTLLIGLIVWALAGDRSARFRTERNNITISEVTQGAFNDYIRLNGQVEPGTIVQISALESGIVETKHISEGSMVRKGDIILTLRNPHLTQQILDSEAQLAEKQNMLRDTEISMEKDKLSMQQDLLTTTTEYNRYRRAYEQQKTLYEERLTSLESYLQAQENYRLAESRLNLLHNRIRQDSLYRSVQIERLRESLTNMEHNLQLVRQRADNLKIRASYDGQLGSLTPELGQNIPSGAYIGQINILDNYKIQVNIDEHYIDRITLGLTGKFERQNNSYNVHVNKVYPEVKNGQFRTDLIFDAEHPENIRVGQTYYINLELGKPTESMLIPRGSFYQTTGGRWIFVINNEGTEATRRDIRIGRQNPQYYEITEGLRPGEKVITSGYENFGEAEKIIIQ